MTPSLFSNDTQRLEFLLRLKQLPDAAFTAWEEGFFLSATCPETAVPFNDLQRAVIDGLFQKYAVRLVTQPAPGPSAELPPGAGLVIPIETPLVPLDTVRAARRADAKTIMQEVEAGKLRWVWDVRAGRHQQRELRFWTRELVEPEAVATRRPHETIQRLIGDRDEWRVHEIADLLVVSRPTVYRLRKELRGTPGKMLRCKRTALVDFFRRRLQ